MFLLKIFSFVTNKSLKIISKFCDITGMKLLTIHAISVVKHDYKFLENKIEIFKILYASKY